MAAESITSESLSALKVPCQTTKSTTGFALSACLQKVTNRKPFSTLFSRALAPVQWGSSLPTKILARFHSLQSGVYSCTSQETLNSVIKTATAAGKAAAKATDKGRVVAAAKEAATSAATAMQYRITGAQVLSGMKALALPVFTGAVWGFTSATIQRVSKSFFPNDTFRAGASFVLGGVAVWSGYALGSFVGLPQVTPTEMLDLGASIVLCNLAWTYARPALVTLCSKTAKALDSASWTFIPEQKIKTA